MMSSTGLVIALQGGKGLVSKFTCNKMCIDVWRAKIGREPG